VREAKEGDIIVEHLILEEMEEIGRMMTKISYLRGSSPAHLDA
jgi:hypothetical protein